MGAVKFLMKLLAKYAKHERNKIAGPKILSNKRNTGRGAALHRILLQRRTSGGTAHRTPAPANPGSQSREQIGRPNLQGQLNTGHAFNLLLPVHNVDANELAMIASCSLKETTQDLEN
jgi:hypothetical protein